MTARTTPDDDIIELTDIVEEGIIELDFDEFPLEKAVDTKSLDEELDALLRDASTSPKPGAVNDDEVLDFESLVQRTDEKRPDRPGPRSGDQATNQRSCSILGRGPF